MRIYENLFIVRPDATEEEIDHLIELLSKNVTNAGGTVEDDGETSLPHVWVAHTASKAILAAAHGVEVGIGVNQAILADDVAATLSGS